MKKCIKNHTIWAVAVWITLLGASSALSAAPRAKPHLPFLIGADWDDSISPGAQQLFLESGCNFVRLTGGGFGWSLALHKRELAELRGHGIYALLQLGSHWPDGSYLADTDDFFVDQNGKSGTVNKSDNAVEYGDSGGWPQYSYAGNQFRAKLEKDFTTYLQALGSDPSVVMLLLHNEPGYFWVQGRIFDYNPEAIDAFRAWLPSQHRTIADLNASWHTDYASFADVQPPRQLPPVSNIAAWMDWRRFNIVLIARFLTWEEQLAKRICPNLPSTTNMSGPLDNWFALRLGDNYRYTAPFDWAGVDIYSTDWTNKFSAGYAMDMTRGAASGKPIIVPECDSYAPSAYPSLSPAQRADRLRSDLWRYAGHGAKAILIWTWGDPGEYNVTTGEYNDRVRTVRTFASLAKMLHLETFSAETRRVALVVDQDAFLYYGGVRPGLDGGSWCQTSVLGMYAALESAGYAVDIVSADQVRSGVLAKYRAAVLATQAISDGRLASSIGSFVANGGLVIAQAPLAQYDRWGKAIPPDHNGLLDLFGITESSPFDDNASGAIPGLGIDGQGRAAIDLAGATALARFRDGSPAVTSVRRGKGAAILIATDVGENNADGEHPQLSRFLERVIQTDAHVRPLVVATSDGYVDASLLQDDRGNRLITVCDTSDKKLPPSMHPSVDLEISARLVAPKSQAFVIAPGETISGRLAAGPRPVRITRDGAATARLRLANLSSADIVLIASDHSPLLSIDAPSDADVGSAVRIDVTCFNPSPARIAGVITLKLPAGWRAAGPAANVSIPARGQATVRLFARAGTTPGRAMLQASLSLSGTATPIGSVPVDIITSAST